MRILKKLALAFTLLLVPLAGTARTSSAEVVLPKLITRGVVPYPVRSKQIGEEGTVWVKVLVRENGTAGRVVVARSSGSPDLDAYAQEVAEKSEYRPASRHGKAMQSWLVVPIVCTLPEIVKGDEAKIDALKQAVAHSPKKAELYENLGFLYLQESRWAEARKVYMKATDLDPSNVDNWVALGEAELRMEEFPLAREHYEKALTLSPDDPQATAGLAKALASMGKKEEALPLYEKAARLNPKDASLQATVGDLLVSTNQLDKALPVLEKAHALNPENFTVLQDLGYIYYQRRDYANAAKIYEEAVKFAPGNAVLYENLGGALLNSGGVQDAIPVLEKATQLDPKNSGAYYSLGIAYFEQKEYGKAVPALQTAIQLFSAQKASEEVLGDTYFELGLSEFQVGEKEEGLQSLEQAAGLKPGDTMVLMALAQVYENLKQPDKAVTAYEKVLKLDPKVAEAHESLGYLYYQKNDIARAKQELRAAADLYAKENKPEKAKSVENNLKKLRGRSEN